MSDIAKSVCGAFFKYMTGKDNLDREINPNLYLPQNLLQPQPPRFIRKFRWTYSEVDENGEVVLPERFVKVAARPTLTIDEHEIHLGQGKTWIPGKAEWEAINVTYYGLDENDEIYDHFNQYFNEGFHDIQKNTGILKLYDGTGALLETWQLNNTFIQNMNWNIDYAGESDIEVQLRYDNVNYINHTKDRQL